MHNYVDILYKHGIRSINDLVGKSIEDLYKLPGFGKASFHCFIKYMWDMGVHFDTKGVIRSNGETNGDTVYLRTTMNTNKRVYQEICYRVVGEGDKESIKCIDCLHYTVKGCRQPCLFADILPVSTNGTCLYAIKRVCPWCKVNVPGL